jgi:hypothetical protein
MSRPVTCTTAYVLTVNASSSPTRTQPQRHINARPGRSKLSGSQPPNEQGRPPAMKSLVEAADRVGWSRAHSSVAVTASRSTLPGSRGKPVVHAFRIFRLATAR